ncbi:MAG: sigma-70 family RNA polymerase sigma factor [Thermomicrobiaceae bacterium]|nr:sigma-70 family RNA polymerase sigma factor [Thermomicrobiaceae bacterium]
MTHAPEEPSDEALVARARDGDLRAFNLLVERYERVVYALCLRMLRDGPAAEDAAQDTFIRAYTSLDQFQGAHLRAWLLRIATNRCYDLLRARARRPADSLEAEAEEPGRGLEIEAHASDPVEEAARRELQARLEAALARLPADQRLVVLLHDVHGYQYDEIAEITGVALGTVKSRLSRGRASLREILRADACSWELFEAVGRQFLRDDLP